MVNIGSCKHPLKGFQIGYTASGKPDYKIVGFACDHVEFNGKTWLASLSKDVSPFSTKVVRDYIIIPCGRCIGCRLQYSRDWANRCMFELKDHKKSYFVTLTYDDDHLNTVDYVDDETGQIIPIGTLVKRDYQLFMKKLRKKLDRLGKPNVRYFCAGEYGDSTHRPHFHAIIFGLELDDLKLYSRNELGDPLYTSEFLTKVWENGHVIIGDVTWETCAYVARYVTKKLYGTEAEVYEKYGFTPEFTLMSNRPGIGRNYYDELKGGENPLIYDEEFQTYNKYYLPGGKIASAPRYFKRLYESDLDIDDPYWSDKKVNSKLQEDLENLKLNKTSKSYLEMLETEENYLKERTKALVRDL